MPSSDPVISPFPAEVLMHIAEDVARPDLARLLRVNSFFHQAFIKALYTRVPAVVVQNRPKGTLHKRPPFKLPQYAQHVRCLEVPVWPSSCCRVPSKLPRLPALEVISLEPALVHGKGSARNASAATEFCPLPSTLRAKTVVIRYPFLYDGGNDVSENLMNDETQFVVFLDVAGGDGQNPAFGELLDIVDFEIPELVRDLTIVLKPSTEPAWKFLTVSTLVRLCDHFEDANFHTFSELRSLTFVLGDEAFSTASRDAILADVRTTLRSIRQTFLEGGEPIGTYPDTYEIKILLLPEFLALKDYGPVMSADEAAGYMRLSEKHTDFDKDIQDVIRRSKEASASHIRQLDNMFGGANSSNESLGDDGGYDYDDPEWFEGEESYVAPWGSGYLYGGSDDLYGDEYDSDFEGYPVVW